MKRQAGIAFFAAIMFALILLVSVGCQTTVTPSSGIDSATTSAWADQTTVSTTVSTDGGSVTTVTTDENSGTNGEPSDTTGVEPADSTTRTTASTVISVVVPSPGTTASQSKNGTTVTSTAKATTTTAAISADTPPTSVGELASSQYYGRLCLSSHYRASVVQFYDALVSGVESGAASVKAYDLSAEEIRTTLLYYRADYPQHFWLGFTWTTVTYDSYTDVKLDYDTAMRRDADAFEAAVQEMLSGISASMSEYERALLLHDRLVKRVTYDSTAPHAHSAYGALVEGRAVCEGYARAYQYLLYRAGIQALYITGYAREEHAWNAVRLDGNYVLVDATWDDPMGVKDPNFVSHAYFGLTSEELARDHTADTDEAYPQPNCTSTAYQYHRRNGSYVESYTVNSIAQLLKDADNTLELYIAGDMSAFVGWLNQNAQAIANQAQKGFSATIVGNEIIFTLS